MELTEEQKINRRASQKKYRDKNKEKYNANQNNYTKKWYEKNKEAICAKKREAYMLKKMTALNHTTNLQ